MKKQTILWADDDADDLQMMHEILLKINKDYNIVEVGNGKEALNCLERSMDSGQLPSLVILDINMPVLDGKETLAIIKSRDEWKSIPIVIFTTSESELDKLFCQRFNTQMITKPPLFSILEDTIVNLLGFANKRA